MGGLFWLVGIIIVLVGLVQLPLVFDLIRSCAPNKAPKRLVGPILDTIIVIIMCAIFGAVFHLYFWVFLPAHISYKDPWLDSTGLYHLALFWFLFLNTVCNYVCTVFTPPGSPPRVTMTPDNAMSISIESCIPTEKICLECKCVKADTTHHCSVCKQCVLYMDHHCPFVMGCVGLNNYHYFYCFMVYFYSGMVYSLYLTYGPFLHCHGSTYVEKDYNCDKVGFVSILCIVIGFNMVGATLMNTFNLVALFSNTSTMSCLISSLQSGLVASARIMISQLTLRALTNTRSRLHTLLLSKRAHILYFLIPPLLTAVKLFLKHALTKKRTINFKFPKMPKKTGLIA